MSPDQWHWSCLCPIHWSKVLSWEWRYSWSSADRRCSNYIWVINNFITYEVHLILAWLEVWRYIWKCCQPRMATLVSASHTIQSTNRIRGPFHEGLFHRNSISMEISFYLSKLYWHDHYEIYTWHAVMACAKFCSDTIPYNGVTPNTICHQIWITMEKSFMKWAQGFYVLSSSRKHCAASRSIKSLKGTRKPCYYNIYHSKLKLIDWLIGFNVIFDSESHIPQIEKPLKLTKLSSFIPLELI